MTGPILSNPFTFLPEGSPYAPLHPPVTPFSHPPRPAEPHPADAPAPFTAWLLARPAELPPQPPDADDARDLRGSREREEEAARVDAGRRAFWLWWLAHYTAAPGPPLVRPPRRPAPAPAPHVAAWVLLLEAALLVGLFGWLGSACLLLLTLPPLLGELVFLARLVACMALLLACCARGAVLWLLWAGWFVATCCQRLVLLARNIAAYVAQLWLCRSWKGLRAVRDI